MLTNDRTDRKKGSKRFNYSATATVQIHGSREMVQIQDISKSGIQFFSNAHIPKQTQIKMMWQDPKVGAVETNLVVVRTFPKTKQSSLLYAYGSKFVNFDLDSRKNLNKVIEVSEEIERQSVVKNVETLNFKTISDAIVRGRMYLLNILRGNTGQGIMDQFMTDLKVYEKDSFNNVDPVSQWIQKLSTQYFHTRILISVLLSSVRMPELNKVVTDKLHSIDILLKECNGFMDASQMSDNPKIPLRETFNRLKYGKIELKETHNKSIVRLLGARRP